MNDDLSADCPEDGCNGMIPFTMADVRHERTVRCGHGHSVQLRDDGGGARQMERQLRRIDPNFRW